MASEETTREVSPVLRADINESSGLTRKDKEPTVPTFTHDRELISRLILKYHGRAVDSTGSNVPSGFDGVRDAMHFEVEIWRELKGSRGRYDFSSKQNNMVLM